VTALRGASAAMILAGLATAGLPFLTWYSVAAPAGDVTATGVDASAELWSLVALGGVLVGVGVAAARERYGVAAMVVALVATAICVGWVVENALNAPVGLSFVGVSGMATPVADDLVRTQVQPAAWLAAAAAAIGGMAAIVARLDQTS
jgi:hypothetical protein